MRWNAGATTRWGWPTPTAHPVREALHGMCESFNGMTEQSVVAEDMLAYCRAEGVSCLLQELVSNLIRHCGASRCTVIIQVQADQVSLQVKNDGQGWHANGMASDPGPLSQGTGLGVVGMEWRTQKLGGSHLFDTCPLGEARVQVPLATTTDES